MQQEVYTGPERRWKPRYLSVGPVSLPYVSREKALQTIRRSFEDRQQINVAFCNANTMLKAFQSKDYAAQLERFLILNDGIGVDLCSMIFSGERFPENLNGTDFVPDLLDHRDRNLRIFLLGSKQGIAEQAASRLIDRFPTHQVVGTHHGYFQPDEIDTILRVINDAKPDVVLVGLGNPSQEQFIATYGKAIDAPVLIAVGALFDFLSGRVIRAPRVVRGLRMEWVFRLLQEPRRLGRRYTIDIASFLINIAHLRLLALFGDSAARGHSLAQPAPARRLRPNN